MPPIHTFSVDAETQNSGPQEITETRLLACRLREDTLEEMVMGIKSVTLDSRCGVVETMGEEQELTLVRQCLQGDALAWETMVNAFGGQISRQVRRYGRLREEAEDLTQEVFLKVYLNLGTFRANNGKLSHWLRRVGRNLIIDHLRRSRCFASHAGMEQLQAFDQQGEQNAAPEKSAALNEAGRLLREGLQALAPELQQVLRMKYLKEMSYLEISQQLGVPDGTVKSRLYRGRAKLAGQFGKQRKSGRTVLFSLG